MRSRSWQVRNTGFRRKSWANLGKFFRKDEGGGGDALFDFEELFARALEIRFGGAALQRWTVANAIELEIELDAIAPEGIYSTINGLTAHDAFLLSRRHTDRVRGLTVPHLGIPAPSHFRPPRSPSRV
ncbi:MAG TPA: hypothetical protein VMV25_07325 [Steroidobacteraceae bacterium]|nr:hypothetical protein [Steroidobacteraceae bacterium]